MLAVANSHPIFLLVFKESQYCCVLMVHHLGFTPVRPFDFLWPVPCLNHPQAFPKNYFLLLPLPLAYSFSLSRLERTESLSGASVAP